MYRIIAVLWVIVVMAARGAEADHKMITKSGCNETCVKSHVKIPYPFGIGSSCYHNSSEHYEIVCKPSSNSSSGAFIPFLRKLDIRVFHIDFNFHYDHFYESDGYALWVPADREMIYSNSSNSNIVKRSLIGTPFSFSGDNAFIVEGCPGRVDIRNSSGVLLGRCITVCQDDTEAGITRSGACNGVGCCSISNIQSEMKEYEIQLSRLTYECAPDRNVTMSACVNVTYQDGDSATWYWKGPQISKGDSAYHVPSFHCNPYRCYCKHGFHGNPYLPYGCQAVTTPQSDAKKNTMILGFSISLGSITMVFFGSGLFRVIQRWRQIKRKAAFFKRNGGLLLQQQMTTSDNMVDRTKVFSDAELEKATDNYNGNRILGRGGQGTVYKGMLLDGRVIAVKKALKVDESQIEHFINEVVILSQISHRNVVKLLGCCLETEVPLLVYEFIPNGTLSQHIHNPSEEFYITWKMRLQIATESAEALRYLHSASATPIYHRDVKSSNILLDKKYRAKVADFGTSRTLTIDQTHLTTLVQGTLGYLDPEYFQTNQFTEKSDVYSFGVVLVELLTGQKPLSTMQSGGWKSLTMEFLSHMESSRLLDIIDSRILVEAKKEELLTMASLAKKCLNLNGKYRPKMKEVASILEGIRPSTLPVIEEQIFSKVNNEIMEMGELHDGQQLASSTFCSENNEVLGARTSIEVNPLMHYTI